MLDFQYIQSNRNSPALLLVHGLYTSKRLWDSNIEALSEKFNVVMVDLPGHGSSPGLKDSESAKPENIIDSFDTIRRALNIKEWFICGQSFGAALTIRYSLRYPEFVIAQAFTNSQTAFRDNTSKEQIEIFERRIKKVTLEGMSAIESEAFHPNNAKRFPEHVKSTLSLESACLDVESYLKILSITMRGLGLSTLGEVPIVPSLLVNGKFEKGFQVYIEKIISHWPKLFVETIEAGHSVNVENPQAFNRSVISFFQNYR